MRIASSDCYILEAGRSFRGGRRKSSWLESGEGWKREEVGPRRFEDSGEGAVPGRKRREGTSLVCSLHTGTSPARGPRRRGHACLDQGSETTARGQTTRAVSDGRSGLTETSLCPLV